MKDSLFSFSSVCGVGNYPEALEHGKKLLSPYGSITTTALGSVICTVKAPTEGKHHILLDAHLDEIGLIVTNVEDNGFLRVADCKGTDPRVYAASLVLIHTDTETITGVICSVPPHLNKGEKKVLASDEIYIDTGLSTEEAKEKIMAGDVVSFISNQQELLNGRLSSKALDDRAGCVVLLKALDYLGDNIPCGLSVMFSSMEELGGMGAETSAFSVFPTLSLAVDVTFGDFPDAPSGKTKKLGSGAAIGVSPLLSKKHWKLLANLGDDNEIPYEFEVMGGRTGTNADAIVTTRCGVPSALISVPLRNMHTPVEMVDMADIDHCGKLIALWVQAAGKEEIV